MVYGQALKFLNTEVFAVLEDQTIFRGLLIRVELDSHAVIISDKPKPTYRRVHLRYVFPQK